MTDFRPFAALRFARDPTPRIAPPYDVISPAERTRLAAEPENIVHLTLPPGPEGERDYAAAADALARWRREGVLVQDECEQLYLLEERLADGRVRRGWLGRLRLAHYAERIVLPHERTMPGPKRDRLLLTRSVRANLEPLFFVYEDRDAKLASVLEEAARGAPLAAARASDGSDLALFGVPGRAPIDAVCAFLAERPVIIADGHHRYETMLAYRDECRDGPAPDPEAPHEFVLAYLVNAFDPGSRVGSIHRVLRSERIDLDSVLRECGFAREPVSRAEEADSLLELLTARSAVSHAFIFVRSDGEVLLARRARGERLDVEVLHEELLPRLGGELSFDSRPGRVLETVRSGEATLGILLNPVDPESLFRSVQAGAILPQKSTFFTPKVPSGLVLRDLGSPEGSSTREP